jgi:hypothetical protein
MHFVYGICDGSAQAAMQEYRRHFPDWRISSKGMFLHVHHVMHESGSLPSVCVKSKKEVVPDINICKNILEMVQKSPKLPTCGIASCISVLCMQVWQTARGRFTPLSRSEGWTSWTRRAGSVYGFVPLDNRAPWTV